jgi:hypothetical protein
MPITSTPLSKRGRATGASWVVADETLLADLLARISLGQAHHALAVLEGVLGTPLRPSPSAADNAIEMLTVKPGVNPWHRDGWVFQCISWIVASIDHPSSILKPPQMIFALKGFDGVRIDLDAGSQFVERVVIFEDKATKNPVSVISGKVWPELAKFENGDYDTVLETDLVALLATRPDLDRDAAIKTVIWDKRNRSYRVAITADKSHTSNAGFAELFKGYEKVVVGKNHRRGAYIFVTNDVRGWISHISNLAIVRVHDLTKDK